MTKDTIFYFDVNCYCNIKPYTPREQFELCPEDGQAKNGIPGEEEYPVEEVENEEEYGEERQKEEIQPSCANLLLTSSESF